MSVQDPQDSSLFFQNLPTEIRLEIYSNLFYSTRLSFGKRSTYVPDRLSAIRLRPAPNGLSLLRVCRRVSNEIGDSWLGQVLFSFEDPVTMLDKLADLDLQTRGKLRHIRYSNRNSLVMESVVAGAQDIWWTYRLPEWLKVLRGLRLDRLTVLGQSMAQCRYLELDALINHSDGWKELYYLSHNSLMLGFGKFDKAFGKFEWKRELRAPQPSTWSQALAARDGPTASVTIYRSTEAAMSGSMISKPATCQGFADQVAEPGKESQYGVESDMALMKQGEKEKEILVVARRGKGVEYTETGTSPMMQGDIRELWSGMTWGQMRYMGIDWFDEQYGLLYADDDGDENTGDPSYEPHYYGHNGPRNSDEAAGTEVDGHGNPVIVDTYEHADDYEWGPYHTVFSPD